MKDRVETGHLTKYDAFRVNRDQVMDLEIRFKSIQTSVILRKRPVKPYNSYNLFVTTVKSCHAPSI